MSSRKATAFSSVRRLALRVGVALLLATVLPMMLPSGVAPAEAQKSIHIPAKEICVLKAMPFQGSVNIPPPVSVEQGEPKTDGSATFDITFNGGWPQQAQDALIYAADSIWGGILDAPGPINVRANWQNIGGGTLGFAGPTTFRRGFVRAPKDSTFYPIALANALAGADLNGPGAEIALTLNSGTNWYYGTDGNVPSNQFSLVTVALHELAHGLGFTGTADVNNAGEGSWGIDIITGETLPVSYDTFVEDGVDTSILDGSAYPNPSMALGDILTDGGAINQGVFFEGNLSAEYKLYTPLNWNPGSSYSHFSLAEGTELMRPGTAPGQSIQDPGKATDVLMDSGWDDALPVELASFEGVADDGDVVLSWRTLSETNNDHFRIFQEKNGRFVEVGTAPSQVAGGTTNKPQDYSFRVEDVAPGRHTFRLTQVDIDDTEHFGDETTVEVALGGAFHLSGAYPNPFRTQTRLDLTVKETQEVRVALYDALGRRVAVPFEGVLNANDPKAVTLEGGELSSGLYLVRVEGESFSGTRTVTLVQ